jgi:hypothetical protein
MTSKFVYGHRIVPPEVNVFSDSGLRLMFIILPTYAQIRSGKPILTL